MKKLLYLLISVFLLTSGCGKYGKLKLPKEGKEEKKQDRKLL